MHKCQNPGEKDSNKPYRTLGSGKAAGSTCATGCDKHESRNQ